MVRTSVNSATNESKKGARNDWPKGREENSSCWKAAQGQDTERQLAQETVWRWKKAQQVRVNVAINFERRWEVMDTIKSILKFLVALGTAAGIVLAILNFLNL